MARIMLKFGGLSFAVLPDVSMSIFTVHFLGRYFGEDLRWWHYLVIAPLIGIFPDFDAFAQFFTKRKIDDAHHIFLHYPPFMIAAGFACGLLNSSAFWGTAMAIILFLHYLHDSTMCDFGLKWLWPYTQNQYHFCGKKYGENRVQAVIVYTPAELEKLEEKGAFVTLQEWLEKVYYIPSGYAKFELLASTILLGVFAGSYFQNPIAPPAIMLAVVLLPVFLWFFIPAFIQGH